LVARFIDYERPNGLPRPWPSCFNGNWTWPGRKLRAIQLAACEQGTIANAARSPMLTRRPAGLDVEM